MKILIGEGKDKYDILTIDGEFDIFSEMINQIHYLPADERFFVFLKDKKTDVCKMFEKPDLENIEYGPNFELLIYQNPSLIALQAGGHPEFNKDRMELFIGVNSGAGLKFTITDLENFSLKNIIRDLNNIKDGLGFISLSGTLRLWTNGKIRAFKLEQKDKNSKDAKVMYNACI